MEIAKRFNTLFVKYLLFSLLIMVNAVALNNFSKSDEFGQNNTLIVLLFINLPINYLFYRFFLKKWNLSERHKDFFIYGTSLFFVMPSLFSKDYFKNKDKKIAYINSIQELENPTNPFYKMSSCYINSSNYFLLKGMVARGKGGRGKEVSANYVFPLYNNQTEEELNNSCHIFLGITKKKDFHATLFDKDSYVERKRKEVDSILASEYKNFEIDTSAYYEKIDFSNYEDNFLLEAAQSHQQFDDSHATIIIKPLNKKPDTIQSNNLIGVIISNILGFLVPLIGLLIAFKNKKRLSSFFLNK
jgi:hypothetical protein